MLFRSRAKPQKMINNKDNNQNWVFFLGGTRTLKQERSFLIGVCVCVLSWDFGWTGLDGDNSKPVTKHAVGYWIGLDWTGRDDSFVGDGSCC